MPHALREGSEAFGLQLGAWFNVCLHDSQSTRCWIPATNSHKKGTRLPRERVFPELAKGCDREAGRPGPEPDETERNGWDGGRPDGEPCPFHV